MTNSSFTDLCNALMHLRRGLLRDNADPSGMEVTIGFKTEKDLYHFQTSLRATEGMFLHDPWRSLRANRTGYGRYGNTLLGFDVNLEVRAPASSETMVEDWRDTRDRTDGI